MLLTNACVFTATGSPPLDPGAVAVEDGRITWVGPAGAAAALEGAVVVDCAGRTIVPGFIDAHVHLVYREGLDDWYSFDRGTSLEEAGIDATLNAGRLLRMGVTSVRDVGTRGNVAVLVRDAVRDGRLHGPRIRAAKQIIGVTGGLVDVHPTHLPDVRRDRATTGRLVSGPWEARDAVREQVKDGVDWVKVEASGTFNSPYCPGDRDTISSEELGAVVEEARLKGRPVACHAESATSIVRAANAGVRTVEHAVNLDDEGLEALLRHDVAICPTIEIYRNLALRGREFGLPSDVVDANVAIHQGHVESIRRAYRAGVTIIAGSDAGSTRFPHDGALFKELATYVELVGMTPHDALLSATATAAHVIGLGEEVGTLEAGKRADLVILGANPLEDFAGLSKPGAVEAVLIDGEVVAGHLPATRTDGAAPTETSRSAGRAPRAGRSR